MKLTIALVSLVFVIGPVIAFAAIQIIVWKIWNY